MIVTQSQFAESVKELCATGIYGLDTESTGLRESDRLFCITIFTDTGSWYFNFQEYPFIPREYILPREFLSLLQAAFDNPSSTWFIHNAKNDLKFLYFEGLLIKGTVICTEVQERVYRNNYIGSKPYSLAQCAKRRELKKDEEVDRYIMEYKLYEKIQVPGKKKAVLLKHFDQVPFEVISKRAEGDAELHYKIGRDQQRNLLDDQKVCALNEVALTPVCFKMERWGVKIDPEYTRKALEYEQCEILKAQKEFEEATGIPFSDGRNCLAAAFTKLGEAYPTTALGNPSFTEKVLEGMSTPVARMVNKIRKHQKRAGTYYSSFLYFADANGVIHANIRQAGTETGRFSYSDPNLQNVPKEDDEEDQAKPYLIRACIIPNSPGTPLVSLDYKQQEFRVMVDYAGELPVIRALLEGADPHDIVKDQVGCTRREAKVLNFGIPYGMGKDKLAGLLGKTPKEAQEFKDAWFGRMPNVSRFFDKAARVGRRRGYVFNWLGRRCYLEDPDFAYILPNHIIQGGCADVLKKAMVQINELFEAKRLRTQLNIQVHDELVFNWHPLEYEEILGVKKIMESVYIPKNGMKLETSIDHSFKNWGAFSKVKGPPC